jgi:hypothetical protein
VTEYLDPVGYWQDLATGVDPTFANKEDADGALDQAGTPALPVYTRIDGPWGLPWWDGKEDPNAVTDLFASANPSYPDEDVGALPIVGAYEPAVRTLGPVLAWGHEPSGGLTGDQAVGRIMRFPANIPERYDANGVWNIDYLDELAQAVANGNEPIVTEAEYTTSLLLGPGGTWTGHG